MRRFSRRVPLALLCVLATGCARNAAIDVDLTLPPASDRGFAVVAFARGGDRFDAQWDDSTAVTLGASDTPVSFSILTEDFDRSLRIRVRFCRHPGCVDTVMHVDEGLDAPSLWYELEAPFYRGERTSWWRTIGCVPSAPATSAETIDRCEIAGCVMVAPTTPPLPPPPVSYCRSDGTHFCQAPTGIPAPDVGRRDAGPALATCHSSPSDAGPLRDVGPMSDGASGGDH